MTFRKTNCPNQLLYLPALISLPASLGGEGGNEVISLDILNKRHCY